MKRCGHGKRSDTSSSCAEIPPRSRARGPGRGRVLARVLLRLGRRRRLGGRWRGSRTRVLAPLQQAPQDVSKVPLRKMPPREARSRPPRAKAVRTMTMASMTEKTQTGPGLMLRTHSTGHELPPPPPGPPPVGHCPLV